MRSMSGLFKSAVTACYLHVDLVSTVSTLCIVLGPPVPLTFFLLLESHAQTCFVPSSQLHFHLTPSSGRLGNFPFMRGSSGLSFSVVWRAETAGRGSCPKGKVVLRDRDGRKMRGDGSRTHGIMRSCSPVRAIIVKDTEWQVRVMYRCSPLKALVFKGARRLRCKTTAQSPHVFDSAIHICTSPVIT